MQVSISKGSAREISPPEFNGDLTSLLPAEEVTSDLADAAILIISCKSSSVKRIYFPKRWNGMAFFRLIEPCFAEVQPFCEILDRVDHLSLLTLAGAFRQPLLCHLLNADEFSAGPSVVFLIPQPR
jgi:hypothetical protein